ncbi:MAG: hypothetical protein Q9160_008226 [Pyrenula sp. 1 TL-2023]
MRSTTKEHEELLNVIDKVRSLGVGRFVDLPQIIVCGDQSSGKSSVLEAVSSIRFPVQANLCTRVATELILRRTSDARTVVSIVPSRDRSEEETEKLEKWGSTVNNTLDFAKLVNDAMAAMGVNRDSKRFGDDILRVEHSGPQQPNLTLVDLPGLFHAATQDQSSEDKKVVTKLVTSYMRKSRSIILAVITAKNDIAGQVVLDRIREIDPSGRRSMGVITKPDTLEGDDDRARFLKLAENKEIDFQLGWHVLRNRDPNMMNCSDEVRDRKEAEFFATGVWRSLPTPQVGIQPLVVKLDQILQSHILTELPGLIGDVEMGIDDCDSRLARLGDSRETLQQQKVYLLRISQTFSTLMKSAIDGIYNDAFFGSALTDEGYSKRLRAVVQNVLGDLARDRRVTGGTHEILDLKSVSPQEKDDYPIEITREDWLQKVQQLMKRTKGCELPGIFNPQIVSDLFYEQSQPWESAVDDYAALLVDAAKTAIDLIMETITDDTIGDGISGQILNPSMVNIRADLNDKIEEVLAPHKRGHPITYNHYLTDNIQKARQGRMKTQLLAKLKAHLSGMKTTFQGHLQAPHGNWSFDPEALVESLTQATEADMDRFACSEATDVMFAYYKVGATCDSRGNGYCLDRRLSFPLSPLLSIHLSATPQANLSALQQVARKKIVDDFSVLAIEECLLTKLPGLLSPEVIMELDDETIESIAAETEDSKTERARATEKLNGLRKTLDHLRRLSRHRRGGWSFLACCSPGSCADFCF